MFGFFKSHKEKRERKRKLKRVARISSVFGMITKLTKSGLIHWDERHRRLFIAEPLADVILAKGGRAWTNFIDNVYQYTTFVYLSNMWQRRLVNRQSKAIAEAKRKHGSLSMDEIQRIRRGVAADMPDDETDMPKVENIEFYVVADSADAGEPRTTLCGVYDPDTNNLDMVLWEEVQAAVAAFHK